MPKKDQRELFSTFFPSHSALIREFLDRLDFNNYLQRSGRKEDFEWVITGPKQGPWLAIATSVFVSLFCHNNCYLLLFCTSQGCRIWPRQTP